ENVLLHPPTHATIGQLRTPPKAAPHAQPQGNPGSKYHPPLSALSAAMLQEDRCAQHRQHQFSRRISLDLVDRVSPPPAPVPPNLHNIGESMLLWQLREAFDRNLSECVRDANMRIDDGNQKMQALADELERMAAAHDKER
ncbi:unnamed protein product, partial [Amoebophrya sp. A25]